MTDAQVSAYLRYVHDFDKRELEYEEVTGAKEYMEKIAEAYKKAGTEMPPVE